MVRRKRIKKWDTGIMEYWNDERRERVWINRL